MSRDPGQGYYGLTLAQESEIGCDPPLGRQRHFQSPFSETKLFLELNQLTYCPGIGQKSYRITTVAKKANFCHFYGFVSPGIYIRYRFDIRVTILSRKIGKGKLFWYYEFVIQRERKDLSTLVSRVKKGNQTELRTL